MISNGLKEDIELLEIDESGHRAITNTGNKNLLGNHSDHNVLVTKFNLKWQKKVKQSRVELFNLKNKEGQMKFKDLTSIGNYLSSAVTENDDIDVCLNRFLKRLDSGQLHCFKKIRMAPKENKEVEDLFRKRKILHNKRVFCRPYVNHFS